MSDYPKIQPEISQPISENLQKLADLFPAAVKDGELDIEALREELGDFAEIHPGDEKYELNWVGKQAAKKKTFEPLLGKTLALKDDGKNADTTDNLYIEGDNLEALKLLRQNYYGEVKMIYIDPPYNTGKDFVYTDKFKVSQEESEEEEGAVSEDGERLTKNDKSSNRFHAKWLDMMYPRLRLAKDLLREDGVLLMSIDENEHHNLVSLGMSVFGEDNFCGEIIWKNSSKNDQDYISMQHEYLVFFVKNKKSNSGNWIERKEGLDQIYKAFDSFKKKHGEDWDAIHESALEWFRQFPAANPIKDSKHYNWMDERGVYFPDNISGPNHGQYVYDVYHPTTNEICKSPASGWRYPKDELSSRIVDNRVHFGVDHSTVPKNKTYLKNTENQSLVSLKFVDGRAASRRLQKLFGEKVFTNPKDEILLKDIMKAVQVQQDDLVLDFFSGSGTTAESVQLLNAETGSSCRSILVQYPEQLGLTLKAAQGSSKNTTKNAIKFLKDRHKPQTIAEIGKERIRRSGKKIKSELVEKAKTISEEEKAANPYLQAPDSLDIGFKSFRIEDTKINWLSKDLRGEEFDFDTSSLSEKDALDFVPGFTDTDVVYELMLRQSNIPLTLPITQPIAGSERTYLYGDSYLICLEESISKKLVEQLAALEPTPLKYFFRDSAFGKDISFKDETFRRLNAEIAKNTADQADAYTVEFI